MIGGKALEDWLGLWWLIGAILLGVVEVMTVDFTFLMLAVGALAAAAAAWIGAVWWVTIIVFGVVAGVMLIAVRPLLLSRLKAKGEAAPVSGTAALVGKLAEAVTPVDEHGGRIKIGGDVWTARFDGEGIIVPGTTLVVQAIDGATAVVVPAPEDGADQASGPLGAEPVGPEPRPETETGPSRPPKPPRRARPAKAPTNDEGN
ncbi:MAG: NfeD family protein [Bifidobacteriaceae bacterium]|jgi:membrane protein implicated in regulation of membrane protease activity|nr:NfeD family protein [Bifidobacteriaceae bacterium]